MLYTQYYPTLLDMGVSDETYWQLTKAEMDDLIDNRNRTFERDEKRRIDNLFLLADAISSRISYIFSQDENRIEPIRPWDVYPVLFAVEKQKHEEAIQEIELEEYKAKRRRHAVEHNARRKEAEHGST
mgnify:CR=1 FL=1